MKSPTNPARGSLKGAIRIEHRDGRVSDAQLIPFMGMFVAAMCGKISEGVFRDAGLRVSAKQLDRVFRSYCCGDK